MHEYVCTTQEMVEPVVDLVMQPIAFDEDGVNVLYSTDFAFKTSKRIELAVSLQRRTLAPDMRRPLLSGRIIAFDVATEEVLFMRSFDGSFEGDSFLLLGRPTRFGVYLFGAANTSITLQRLSITVTVDATGGLNLQAIAPKRQQIRPKSSNSYERYCDAKESGSGIVPIFKRAAPEALPRLNIVLAKPP